jgi:hypothetical protein
MNEPEKRGDVRGTAVTRHHHRHAALSVTATNEYKYGETAEITGKLGNDFLSNVFSGLRAVWSVVQVDKKGRDQGSGIKKQPAGGVTAVCRTTSWAAFGSR